MIKNNILYRAILPQKTKPHTVHLNHKNPHGTHPDRGKNMHSPPAALLRRTARFLLAVVRTGHAVRASREKATPLLLCTTAPTAPTPGHVAHPRAPRARRLAPHAASSRSAIGRDYLLLLLFSPLSFRHVSASLAASYDSVVRLAYTCALLPAKATVENGVEYWEEGISAAEVAWESSRCMPSCRACMLRWRARRDDAV